jgi:hypothetical protein
MNMMKRAVLLLLLLVWATPVSAQILEQSFTDSDASFRISTPNAQWTIDPRGTDPGPVRLTMRFESPVHQFVPNATVRVQDLDSPKIKLDKILKQDLDALPASVELVEKKKILRPNLEGYQILLHDKNSEVVFHQWFFVAKGKSFVITCTANTESYTRMRKDFQKILDSFEIL